MFHQKSRILALDLFRGIAALGIVIFHVIGPYFNQLRSLYFLVDFFFVLSGFVLARAVSTRSWAGARHFVLLRAKRIFPMSVCALFFSEALRITPSVLHRPGSSEDISSYSTELVNLVIALLLLQTFSFSSQLLLFPLWSLSAEWLTNIAAVAANKLVGKLQVIIFIFIGFAMLSLGLFSEITNSSSGWVISLGRCFLCFGTGQLIHKLLSVSNHSDKSKTQPLLALLGIISYYLILNEYGIKGLILAPLPFGYVLWVYGKGERTPASGHLRSLSILAGQYSYGIYVWHIPSMGACDIVLKLTNVEIEQQLLFNLYQLSSTLLLSFFFTFLVLKYVEKVPFSPHGLNSSSQEIK